MARWLVSAEVTISLSTEVEAPTKAAAIKIASERPLQSVHDDGQECSDDTWMTSGELDGTPRRILAERIEPEPTPKKRRAVGT